MVPPKATLPEAFNSVSIEMNYATAEDNRVFRRGRAMLTV